jgi:hypothetical protein
MVRPTRELGPRPILAYGLGSTYAVGASEAVNVSIADADGWFTATDVEAALAELAAKAIGYQAHASLGSTETFDAAIGWHSGTLDADCTFTLTAAPTDTVSSLFLELAQDGTGGWTIDLPASVVNAADIEAEQDTTASETTFLALYSRDGGTTWYGGWWGGGGTGGITVEDEGTPLSTTATTLDFVGSGVTATGTGATKTITIPGGSGSFDEDWLPWTIQLLPYLYKSTTGFALGGNDDAQVFGIIGQSSGTQNDEVAWDIVLAAGTWTFKLYHTQSTNRGIYTVSLDGSSVGTIDGYNASPINNVTSSITSISVGTTQKYELKLKMATKNGSSSGYYGSFNMCQWNRTA